MNWRKLFAWAGALALTAGVLLWISSPPRPDAGDIMVRGNPLDAKPPSNVPSTNVFNWQSEEFSNKFAKPVETNLAPEPSHQEALQIQDLIIQQQSPPR